LLSSLFDPDGDTMALSNIRLQVAKKYSLRRIKKICHRAIHEDGKIKGSK
jgi:hypothetical protein